LTDKPAYQIKFVGQGFKKLEAGHDGHTDRLDRTHYQLRSQVIKVNKIVTMTPGSVFPHDLLFNGCVVYTLVHPHV